MRGTQGTCAITPSERRSLEILPRWSRYCSPAPGRGRAGPAAAQGTESRSDGVGWLCQFPPAHGGYFGRLVERKRCDLSPRRGWAARGWGLSAPLIQTPIHGVNLANQPRDGRDVAKPLIPLTCPVPPRSAPCGGRRTDGSALRPAAPIAGASGRWGRAGACRAVQILGAGPGHAVRIVGAEPCRAARGSPGSGAGAAGPGAERGAGRGGGPGSDTPFPFLGPLAALAPPPRRPAGPAEPRRAGAAGEGAAGPPRGPPRDSPLSAAALQVARGGAMWNGPAPPIPRLGIAAYNWNTECLRGDGEAPGWATAFPQALGLAAAFRYQHRDRACGVGPYETGPPLSAPPCRPCAVPTAPSSSTVWPMPRPLR